MRLEDINAEKMVYYIKAGQKTGVMGKTGSAGSWAHLHMGIYSTSDFKTNTSYYDQLGYKGESFSGDTTTKNGFVFYNPRAFLNDPYRFLK